jgi:PAS domain S-box-containing protein
MSTVEEFPRASRRPTEYEALLSAGPTGLDAFPSAVCLCDRDGRLVAYNSEAASVWGHAPALNETRFCGSHRLFLPDATALSHDASPLAQALRSGIQARNVEVIMERTDGARYTVSMNVRALRDHRGKIEGAINCFQQTTAANQVADELRRKNQEFEDFFENGAIGLHIVSGEGIILRANKAELNLLGYTSEEYLGRHIAEFHIDAPVIGDILQRLSCGEQLDRRPARLRAKDGSIKHVLITSNCRFEQGQLVNTRCFTTDVTELHASEEARRDSEQRLAATYEAATIGIAEADEQGRLLRVNDALCKMLGRPRAQLLGRTFLEYTDGDDRREDAARYALQVRGEIEHYVIRKRATRPDGTGLYLDVHSSSVRSADGRFQYGVRVIQDVTEAKGLEDQIRESERHMRNLLEALPIAVYTTDRAGRITFYNKAAVEMAGRTPQPGEEWCVTWRLYTTDGAPLPHSECPMATALKENRPVRGAEAVAERPDGTRVPFTPYPTPLHDAKGNLVGAINMLLDISDRKQAESRQKVLIDELNHRVKNTLATVQSLAAQTARHAEALPDFMSKFQNRLLAVARAHDLLTRRHWEAAALGSLANEVLAPMASSAQRRMTVEGPVLDLTPRAALSLTMALSELATNAAKYGALSSEHGTLSLLWEHREESGGVNMLAIEWLERGGPLVKPPTRRGFGGRLMERCIEGDLGGVLDLAFEPEGVRCLMSVPISRCAAHG